MFRAPGAVGRPLSLVWLSVVTAVVSAMSSACLPRDADVGRTKPTRDTSTAPKPATSATAPKPQAASKPPTPPPPPDPPLGVEFKDDFERPTLGPDWRVTTGRWKIDGGKVCAAGARNHPVWLKRRLPVNASIEFDATSASPDGDIKAEFWGDGRSGATSVSYTNATSYLAIFGGWKNHFHVLARIDEHAKDRKELRLDPAATEGKNQRVEANRTYHFQVERRDGRTVQWSVDGEPI